jgi:hypothetical protein
VEPSVDLEVDNDENFFSVSEAATAAESSPTMSVSDAGDGAAAMELPA